MAYNFRTYSKSLALGTLLLTLPSCASYKYQSKDFETHTAFIKRYGENPNDEYSTLESRKEASEHPLYKIIPRHRSQIRWFDLPHWISWALFGNDHDGIFGEGPSGRYQTKDKFGLKRASKWAIRNPLHNFTFFVIGTAHSPPKSELALLELGRNQMNILKRHDQSSTVFVDDSTSLFIGFHGFLPFISLRINHFKRTDLYVGWREQGNFGLKFTPFRKKLISKQVSPKKDIL